MYRIDVSPEETPNLQNVVHKRENIKTTKQKTSTAEINSLRFIKGIR